MSQPLVMVDRVIATGPIDFTAANAPRGVNLFCCEQFLTSVIWDEAANSVTVSTSHPSTRWSPSAAASRRELSRAKFECPTCGRNPVVRAEKFVPIIKELVRHGVTKLNLAELEDILSCS